MYLSKRNGIYYIFYRKQDQKKTCKTTKCKKKADAVLVMADFKSQLEQRNKIPSLTLSEFEKILLKRTDHSLTIKSLKHTRSSFRQLRNFIGSDILIQDLKVTMAQDFIAQKFQQSKWGAALNYRHLKAGFSKAVIWGYLPEAGNVFKKFSLPKIPINQPAFINRPQLNEILEQEHNDKFKLLYEIAFETGMRLGEIVTLEWKNVDLIEKKINVVNSDHFVTKSKRARVIYLTNSFTEKLKLFSEENNTGFVFKKDNFCKYDRNYVSRKFKRAVQKTNLDSRVHFHSLRHSAASRFVQSGIDLYIVKELLGHSTIKLTEQYSHLTQNTLKQAIQLLD